MALEVKVRQVATGFLCPACADFAVVVSYRGVG